MLSPIVYRLLANRTAVDARTLRIFVILMADYDLREFTVLQVDSIAAQFHCSPEWVVNSIQKLTALGILERGPHVTGDVRTTPTYRIRRQFLLTDAALKRHYQDLRDRDERAMLLA
jgi:hypothetical protein